MFLCIFYGNISQKSCVFKWIFKKMILKIFYDVIFLEKIFKSRILKNSRSEIFFKKLKSLVFMCILWEYKPNFGHFFSTFSPAQDRCGLVSDENFCWKLAYLKEGPPLPCCSHTSATHGGFWTQFVAIRRVDKSHAGVFSKLYFVTLT